MWPLHESVQNIDTVNQHFCADHKFCQPTALMAVDVIEAFVSRCRTAIILLPHGQLLGYDGSARQANMQSFGYVHAGRR